MEIKIIALLRFVTFLFFAFTFSAIFLQDHFVTCSSRSRRTSTGLVNYGATCYANVVLQLFYQIPAVRKAIIDLKNHLPLSDKFPSPINNIQHTDFRHQVESLSNLFVKMENCQSDKKGNLELALQKFFKSMKTKTSEEEDAYEFFLRILSFSSIIPIADLNPLRALFTSYERTKLVAIDFKIIQPSAFTEKVAIELSLFSSRKQVTLENLIKSTLIDTSLTSLTLRDPSGSVIESFKPEIHYELEFTAPLLTFNLKRITFDGTRKTKLTTKVDYPELLNMREYTNQPEIDCIYRLRAVIVHIGNHKSGHYILYVKKSDGNWLWCNDSLQRTVKLSEVLSKQQDVFILVYAKQSHLEMLNDRVTENFQKSALIPIFSQQIYCQDEEFASINQCLLNGDVGSQKNTCDFLKFYQSQWQYFSNYRTIFNNLTGYGNDDRVFESIEYRGRLTLDTLDKLRENMPRTETYSETEESDVDMEYTEGTTI